MTQTFKNYYAYFALFASGAAVLILEIAGARVLAPFYGSSIYVWSAMITITLGFLALGYFFGGRMADRFPETQTFYGAIFLASLSAMMLVKLNRLILVFSDRFAFTFGPLAAAALLFALPLFIFGMASPILIRLAVSDPANSGRVSGRVFAVSTAGSLFGALLCGYFLIPRYPLGAVLTGTLAAAAAVALGGLFLHKKFKLALIFAGLLVAGLFLPVIRTGASVTAKIIHEEPSFYADLKVVKLRNVSALMMDGAPQSIFSPDGGRIYADETLEIDKLLERYGDEARVLVLGFGAGTAASIFDPGLAVDYVELNPKMTGLAEEYFDYVRDGNDRIFISDARRFLRQSEDRYDLIFIDLYNGNLIPVHTHTREALIDVKARLKPGGMVVSNIIGDPRDELVKSLYKTLGGVFPHTYLSARQAGFTNLLAYAGESEAIRPDFLLKHKEVAIDSSDGIMITDDRNPIDLLSGPRLKDFLEATKKVFGYEPLFAI